VTSAAVLHASAPAIQSNVNSGEVGSILRRRQLNITQRPDIGESSGLEAHKIVTTDQVGRHIVRVLWTMTAS
jgi:hypothetical protein